MIRVLFVCTGNVHRSVLAERLLAARLVPGSAVQPESSGTQARPRLGMEAATRAVLEELGGDGAGFAARPLTTHLVAEATLVLGLAREHREAAVRLRPSALRRCFTLKEFVRLATAGPDGARGTQDPAEARRFDEVVAVAAARRGATGCVSPAEDDIADPWGRPRHVLYECACQIDGEVTRLAGLLNGGAARTRTSVSASSTPQ
ncbi:arsenate reductase/protein-tyrosine-phosphatase family protein [Streptomyces naganishii]|uniref:Low molecular weight phosphatase family protein n=1 Tax=Streptomyces naganishii JCM 4654 TaxID=1306179 RepID=A0A918YAL1_9ACTN|nr:low molecular weight phosphatase family protein [Streptomyces naganishii]GHD96107.1 low molecular weight phosphatase family protein [Streptomyces naganishii JCM 4654]